MTASQGPMERVIFGVDIQSGDVRGEAPSYALAIIEGEAIERDVVTRRKLGRLVRDETPAVLATDNVYELAPDKDGLLHLLGSLPDATRLVQVTGDERPEPLSRVASRHGVPYAKDPMAEAEAAARLAAMNVGHVVSAFTDETEVKVSRGRSTGKGGWSEDRFTRRIHGAVKRRSREIRETLEDAGLDYDRSVTEKYGGYANAVFTVAARPEDIPVGAGRSGDVRVDLERVRRDGIVYEPLAKRRDPVIVGVDPGTTTAAAVVDVDGEVLDVLSTRTADMADLIGWIIERGRPFLVAADVTPMPATVEKLRRSFDAAGWVPPSDLPVDEKLHRTRSVGYDNDHERDAIAAALFAVDDHAEQFERIGRKVPAHVDRGEVTARVVRGEESVEAVLAAMSEGDDDGDRPEPEEAAEPSPESRRIARLERRVERLTGQVEDLRERLATKDDRIESLEEALSAAKREERREVRERRTVTRLERENERLARERDRVEEAREELEGKLERLKRLWRLDHADFADVAGDRDLVPVKPIEKFTNDAIRAAEERFGLAEDDVLLLRDASGAGRSTASRLASIAPRLVLKHGQLSETADAVLFDHGIPVAPAGDARVQEVDDLVVVPTADVRAAIEGWEERARDRRRAQKTEMVDKLISEHRADRRPVGEPGS